MGMTKKVCFAGRVGVDNYVHDSVADMCARKNMHDTQGILFVVATPIGNLGDISKRAVETLGSVDMICAEDTRVTAKLLAANSIRVTLMSLHEHSDDRALQRVIDTLLTGKNVAMVTDAGTPGIADPGGKLVAHAVREGIRVVPIPGVSAVATALSVCGFPADQFFFAGFPPTKKGRQTFFADIALREETIALYESTHRIQKTLAELPSNRLMTVCRELTKLHETIYRGFAPEVIAELATTSSKGEFVIVLAPKKWK